MKRRIICSVLSVVMLIACILPLASCSSKTSSDKSVTIWTGAEDYRNEMLQTELDAKFPDYDITLEYMATGDMAAKVYSEGDSSTADILFDVDYGYLDKMNDALADLSDYDTSIYIDEYVDENHKVLPEYINSGCIVVNTDVLTEKGLAEPTCYDDLLKPEYKGLISMPNPKSSGTGYMFYKALVNSMGEDEAIAYFDSLTDNILQYTTSGSGPVNALVAGEAAVGLGMTAQAVEQINDNAPLKIIYFEEGSPYTLYGIGMIDGKQDDPVVKEVFQYFIDVLVQKDIEEFVPETIYKDKTFSLENYPTDINYADMTGNTSAEKERLLELWTH